MNSRDLSELEFDVAQEAGTSGHPSVLRLPRVVLHVLNSAAGGAAMSAVGLMQCYAGRGIASCAVCHDAGSRVERERLNEATRGRVLYTNLYWWNRKTRAKLWKRPLIELKQGLQTGWARFSTAKVVEFARQNGAELIHTNTSLTPEGGYAASILKLPHVWHLRELLGLGQPFQLAKNDESLQRHFYRFASLIVANSHTTAKTASKAIPAELLRVIPNGIDLAAYTSANRPLNRSSRLVVSMIASLTSRSKKHSLFVQAASILKDVPNIEFRIYGHDPTEGGTKSADFYSEFIYRQIRDAGLCGRLTCPGHVQNPVQILDQTDILVHPAENESFCRAVVEAMAAGVPVVGVRGGGVGEVVQHGVTGFLAEPNQVGQLADYIRQLAVDADLRDRLGRAGRARAEQHYSLEACGARIIQAYGDAMLRPLGE